MTIEKMRNNNELTVSLEGRLDTVTAPSLEAELKANLDGIQELVLDFQKLEYISSAGLRVLLMAQKTMNKHLRNGLIYISDNHTSLLVHGFLCHKNNTETC